MKILLAGSGGREHAIALKLTEQPFNAELFIAPGNAGTAMCGKNIPIKADDIEALASFACENNIDLVISGPEVPLCLGFADEVEKKAKENRKKIAFFGPSKQNAQIEGSKFFAKQLMKELGIPTAEFSVFSDYEKASEYIKNINYPFVIKADGLAAGKGVFLPDSKEEGLKILHELMVDKTLGGAGTQILIEERLIGTEVSIMAFCDGNSISVMPPAQDHKRLKDGDKGPNTGGMGAYAPASVCSFAEAQNYAETTILPIIKKMKRLGTPYVGVLYAGLILTAEGAKVLEYNCRFGDPETQAVLQLFEGDLAATMTACYEGSLKNSMPKWKNGFAASVVLANKGYPVSKPEPVKLEKNQLKNGTGVSVIHAGTSEKDGTIYAEGGRVLCISAVRDSLKDALKAIYEKIETIDFPDVQYRKDIGKA